MKTTLREAISFFKKLSPSRVLESESYVVVLFYLLNTWVHTNTLYLVLLGLYIPVLYMVSRNLKKTLWIALLSSFPFQNAKFITDTFHSYTYSGVSVPIIYFISFTDVLLFSLLGIVIVKEWVHHHEPIVPRDLILIPIVILAGLSTYYSRFFPIAFFGFYQLMKLLSMYILARLVLRKDTWVKLTVEVFLLFVLYNSCLILLQMIRGGPLGVIAERLNTWSIYGRYADETRSLYRPAGITDDPNASATIIGMFIPFLTVIGITKNAFHKGLIWLVLICSGLALIYTGSRSVIIGTAIVVICLLLIARKRYSFQIPVLLKKNWAALCLILVLLVGPLLFLRLSSITQTFSPQGGATYRLRHFQIALDTLLTYPIGTGLNTAAYEVSLNYKPSYYSNDPSEPHNIAAQIVSYLGVPGLILFVLWFTLLLVNLAKSSKKLHNTVLPFAVLFALINYLVASSFYPWFLSIPVSGFFWILAGAQYE